MLEEPAPVGPFGELPVLLFGDPRGDEVPGGAVLADRDDCAAGGAGQRACVLGDLPEDGSEVEARTRPDAGRAEPGDALPEPLDLARQLGPVRLLRAIRQTPSSARPGALYAP